jgi:hypothetical protein
VSYFSSALLYIQHGRYCRSLGPPIRPFWRNRRSRRARLCITFPAPPTRPTPGPSLPCSPPRCSETAGQCPLVRHPSIPQVAVADPRSSQQPLVAKDRYEAHCFPQKISHFDPSINGTFCQRYWLDASSYEAGGPIYLLDGGETSGKNR